MATIYYWKITKQSVGHISMALSDGTYISHWPENNKGLKSTSSKPKQSLKEDIKAEERKPDKCIELSEIFFDSEEISIWWKNLVEFDSLSYHLITSNCAHVVHEALKKLDFKFSTYQQKQTQTAFLYLKTPFWVFKYARSLKIFEVEQVCETTVLVNISKKNVSEMFTKNITKILKLTKYFKNSFIKEKICYSILANKSSL